MTRRGICGKTTGGSKKGVVIQQSATFLPAYLRLPSFQRKKAFVKELEEGKKHRTRADQFRMI